MLQRKFGLILITICLTLLTIQPAFCLTPEAPIVYVARDGSGNFNCDGVNDEVEINQALKYVATHPGFTTVHLKGPATYTIRDTLYIDSNNILEGDKNAVLKLGDHVNWPANKAMIQQTSSSGNHDITIRGFEINGNHDGNLERSRGKGYHNLITLKNSYNISVYNMYMHESHSDGLKVENNVYINTPTNVKFYNNTVYRLGHDVLYCIRTSKIEAYNNTITCRTNSGLRMVYTNNVKLHDNVINSESRSGGPGIEIQKAGPVVMDDIEIYNNLIYNTYGPGIWIFGYGSSYPKSSASNLYIHHNTFYNTGSNQNLDWEGGIVLNGFDQTLIENNVFDSCYGAAVVHCDGSDITAPGTGYITTLRNNIITNTKPHPKSGSGYGVYNKLTGNKFILQNNCLYNNAGGDYKYTGSTTDIHTDPLYADQLAHDYHLKSTAGRWDGKTWVMDSLKSPCIDAGDPKSDYSQEPEDNGNRINIGRYGNTKYASKSNNVPEIEPIGSKTVEEENSLTFTVKASDADGDFLTCSASDLPAGAKFDSKLAFFTWIPEKGQAGSYSVTFKVNDGKQTTSETVAVTVVEKAQARGLYDNRLKESAPDRTFKDSTYIDVGGLKGAGRYRALIWQQGLSTDEDANTVTKATLSLYWYYPENTTRAQDTVLEVYRPAKWDPNTVSWNKKDSTTAWKNAGGDWFDKNNVAQGNTPYATITIKGSQLPDNRHYNLDVTDLVKEYASGKYENTGFLIKARSEDNNYIAFYSSEAENENWEPKLSMEIQITDNRLKESAPDRTLKDSTYIDVGEISGSGSYRGLIGFPLSPEREKTINKATLSMYWYYPENATRAQDTVIEVYRPAKWDPNTVSWNKKDSTTAWKNTGGDWFDKNNVAQGNMPYAAITIKGNKVPDNRYYELDVTNLVKEYASGKYENTGFLIKARSEDSNYIAFYSSEEGNETQKPGLNIIY